MLRKSTATLFNQTYLERVKPLCFIRVCIKSVEPLRFGEVRTENVRLFSSNHTCLESVQSFVFNAHANKAYIHTYFIEYTCFSHPKTDDITDILFNFCHTLKGKDKSGGGNGAERTDGVEEGIKRGAEEGIKPGVEEGIKREAVKMHER